MGFLFIVIGFCFGLTLFQEYLITKNKKPECKLHKWEHKEEKMVCSECLRIWGED